MPKLKTITIDRSKWRRGGSGKTGRDFAKLYNPTEPTQYNMCCLGQYLEQCGVKKTLLTNAMSPGDIKVEDVPKVTKAMEVLVNPEESFKWFAETELTGAAMDINDNVKISGKTREKRLTKLFEKHGIQLVFIN